MLTLVVTLAIAVSATDLGTRSPDIGDQFPPLSTVAQHLGEKTWWVMLESDRGEKVRVEGDWSDRGRDLYAGTIAEGATRAQTDPNSPINQCRQAAIDTCGQGSVCWVRVTVIGGGTCEFACAIPGQTCPPMPRILGLPSGPVVSPGKGGG